MEVWKDIFGYENLYQVSNEGRVKRLFSKVKGTRRGVKTKITVRERIISNILTSHGYLSISFCKNNKVKREYIHRIVATAFLDNPENKPQVNHLDGNRSNSNVKNLEWCTCKENGHHSYYILKNQVKPEKKITQFNKNGEILEYWNSIKDTEKFGFMHSNIIACCNGRRKTHGGFVWKYT